jgi:hypothetical protein
MKKLPTPKPTPKIMKLLPTPRPTPKLAKFFPTPRPTPIVARARPTPRPAASAEDDGDDDGLGVAVAGVDLLWIIVGVVGVVALAVALATWYVSQDDTPGFKFKNTQHATVEIAEPGSDRSLRKRIRTKIRRISWELERRLAWTPEKERKLSYGEMRRVRRGSKDFAPRDEGKEEVVDDVEHSINTRSSKISRLSFSSVDDGDAAFSSVDDGDAAPPSSPSSPAFDDDELRDVYRRYREQEDGSDDDLLVEDDGCDDMIVTVVSPTVVESARDRRKRRATSIAGLPSHRSISSKDDQVMLRDASRTERAKARRKSDTDLSPLHSPVDEMEVTVTESLLRFDDARTTPHRTFDAPGDAVEIDDAEFI